MSKSTKLAVLMALLVAILDCVGHATGAIPASFLNGEWAWFWWLPAAGWGVTLVEVWFNA